MEKTYARFRIYNILMGFLHLGQGVAVVALSNDFSLPLNTTFLKYNTATMRLDSVNSHLLDVRFAWGIAVFFFLSAIFHFFIATGYFEIYKSDLSKHINKARWIEYALSASVMIVLIGLLSGIYDLSTLVLMFGAVAVMNLCGLVMEEVNQNKTDVNWTAFVVGSLAGILPWVAILIYFLGASSQVNNAIPTFVYWIYGSIFVFFNCFAINMYLQYKKIGPWKNYLYGEGMYILLSLTAKSLLAWQIFAGTLRPH